MSFVNNNQKMRRVFTEEIMKNVSILKPENTQITSSLIQITLLVNKKH